MIVFNAISIKYLYNLLIFLYILILVKFFNLKIMLNLTNK